jgi:hypothetical protein
MKRKAQTTMEVAVLLVVLVAALLSIQIYLKRSFQGKYKELADSVGEQYDPLKTTSTRITTTDTISESISNHLGTTYYAGVAAEIWLGPLLVLSAPVPIYALTPSESSQSYTTTNSSSEDYHVASF